MLFAEKYGRLLWFFLMPVPCLVAVGVAEELASYHLRDNLSEHQSAIAALLVFGVGAIGLGVLVWRLRDFAIAASLLALLSLSLWGAASLLVAAILNPYQAWP